MENATVTHGSLVQTAINLWEFADWIELFPKGDEGVHMIVCKDHISYSCILNPDLTLTIVDNVSEFTLEDVLAKVYPEDIHRELSLLHSRLTSG